MERSKVLSALSALAHEARLDLVRLLVPKGDAGMAAGDIGRALGLPASRLSFHLSALEQAGLIRSRRVSRNVIYTADLAGIGGAISYLLADCCMDHPDVLACCAASATQALDRVAAGDSAPRPPLTPPPQEP
ncbi:metalloregulator ArsR/SmtB family transcription factor [Gemmobacter fulvus]|uniref:Metalloregulator ArsR/SmtB family transcription factor n=1 Tax=Gemmobacter fulvus TaxID=2840474 RepID=A0A975P6N5_9RHOB|nr:metalloregulator ArsR/SmtB family transcription factor [Gemmobacter fulvus]MBT9243915.1 metalloregulator ArsR/SmtB family transcription factor [Gemmobacter fulvus]QWK90834.1 metalloregulator ArsR/SmtB family transcription factor [Gemmobacter fulvus]